MFTFYSCLPIIPMVARISFPGLSQPRSQGETAQTFPSLSWLNLPNLLPHSSLRHKMATASVHGDRSQIVSRGKTAPSLGSRTPSAKAKAQKRLNTSDGTSSKQYSSASKTRSPLPKSPATKSSSGRPSDRLNPKTIDPVSACLYVHLTH